MAADYSAEDLGLTPKVGISGRHAPTEVLCREVGTLGGDDRSGDVPASEASVRGEGPHFGGEQPRLAIRSDTPGASKGVRVTPPAKSHPVPHFSRQRDTTLGICSAPNSSSAALASPSPGTTDPAPTIIGRRVDALVLAYKIAAPPASRDEFEERQAVADENGTAALLLDGLSFALRRSRRLHCVSFQNADVRCAWDDRGAGGWNLEIVIRAVFLATHTLRESLALANRIASALGHSQGFRLRRFDLCADCVGFPLRHDDSERILARARSDAFISQAKDFDEASGAFCKPNMREHQKKTLEVTGFTVAPGNPLMARIYNKSAELALAGREEKRVIEYEIWRQNGWDGASEVTRVEFQFRGEALDELSARDPNTLEGRLDAFWQTAVQWLRLVEPGSATRLSRCKLDPRWQTISAVQFCHAAQPIRRRRARGGATSEHAVGAMLSRLASSNKLPRIDVVAGNKLALRDERAFANSLTDEQARAFLRRCMRMMTERLERDYLASLTEKLGLRGAVFCLVSHHNAAVARFSSVDDEPANEPRATELESP